VTTSTSTFSLLFVVPFPLSAAPLLHFASAASNAGLSCSLRSERTQTTMEPLGPAPAAPGGIPRGPFAEGSGDDAGVFARRERERRRDNVDVDVVAFFEEEAGLKEPSNNLSEGFNARRSDEKADAGL